VVEVLQPLVAVSAWNRLTLRDAVCAALRCGGCRDIKVADCDSIADSPIGGWRTGLDSIKLCEADIGAMEGRALRSPQLDHRLQMLVNPPAPIGTRRGRGMELPAYVAPRLREGDEAAEDDVERGHGLSEQERRMRRQDANARPTTMWPM